MSAACWECMAHVAENHTDYDCGVGHFACGPTTDDDVERWMRGERPVFTGYGWVWEE